MDGLGEDLGSDTTAPPLGDEASEPMGEEPADDFEREAFDFLDDSLPKASRALALKEAIKLCLDKDYGGGSTESEADDKGGLAMIFGAPKKKS